MTEPTSLLRGPAFDALVEVVGRCDCGDGPATEQATDPPPGVAPLYVCLDCMVALEQGDTP